MIRDEMHSTLRSFGTPFLMAFVAETSRSLEVDKACPSRIEMKFEVKKSRSPNHSEVSEAEHYKLYKAEYRFEYDVVYGHLHSLSLFG